MPRLDNVEVWKVVSNVQAEVMMRGSGPGRTGNLGLLACNGSHQPKRNRRLWPRRGKPRLLATFLVFLFMRRASCKDVLCLGQSPNCLSRNSPRSLTSFRIPFNRIFSKEFTNCVLQINVPLGRGQCRTLPWFKDADNSGVLPHCSCQELR
jgi:hypothetical protein